MNTDGEGLERLDYRSWVPGSPLAGRPGMTIYGVVRW